MKDVNGLAKLNAPSKGMGQESMRKVGRFQDNMVLMVSEKLPVSSPHILKVSYEHLMRITNTKIIRTIQKKYDAQVFC